MQPIGLTFKHEGWDKYRHKPNQGELILIHRCTKCDKISINRIVGDDNPMVILGVFETSLKLSKKLKDLLENKEISLLTEKNRPEIRRQLFGV